MSINTKAGGKALHILCPEKYDDCRILADYLKAGDPVMADYDYMKPSEAARIHVFVKGCISALGGDAIQISAKVYLYTPLQVTAEKLNRGIGFNTLSMYVEDKQ